MSINVQGLSKVFGNQIAVNNITFSVNEGEILGFLGPNGAGKSTTMKIATTYLPPTSGEILVDGFNVVNNPLMVRKIIGYLPEHNPLYTDNYVKEYLSFMASLHGLRGKERSFSVDQMIEQTGLEKEKSKLIGQLSKGYKQRVGLAQAMIHNPKVLILDEPTSGLDPNQIVEIRELIKNFSTKKTVIFSTHIMQEVQALCDRVVIIDRGNIVADDLVENLKLQTSQQQIITVEFESPPGSAIFTKIEGVQKVEEDGNHIIIHADSSQDIRSEIFKIASERKLSLIGLNKEEKSLEKIFQQLTLDKKND